MHMFMGHTVLSLQILKERILVFIRILNLFFFKFCLCFFSFPHLLNFPQNYFFKTYAIHRGSCCSS